LQDGSTAGGYALATAADLANVSANANYGNSNVAAYLASNSNINLTTTGVIRTSANILTDDRLVANILAIGGNLTVNQHDFVITSSDNTLVMSTGNRSTGNVSISIRANNTLSGINIRNDSGKMGFNTAASGPGNGYTFTFNGSVSASEYYASPNLPTGYQFATVDGDTGLSHAYLSGNLSVLRLRHEGVETVKFYSNNTTEMLGNIVVSDGVHYGQYPNAYLQIYGFANSYQQVINQNLSDNAAASSDFVATADNGSDTTYYINMGINSSQFAQDYWFPTSNTKNDGYLYVTSYNLAGPSAANVGNLVIGSTNGIVKLFVGNTSDSNVVTTFSQNLVTVTGNILPSSNVSYSLGSATAQWKDLWLSNSTLYIDSVPITVTNGELSVNGNVIGGNSAQLSRNSYTVSLETNGNLTVPGNISAGYFIGNGALLTGITASNNYGNSNVVSLLASFGSNSIVTSGNVTVGNLRTTDDSIVLGDSAGGGNNTVSLGSYAGASSQGDLAIAIGTSAGQYSQAQGGIAIGRDSGYNAQGINAVAVGFEAGSNNQGTNSVALGYRAGYNNQAANSIVINASGTAINGSASGFFVAPIAANTAGNILYYDTTTKEIVYGVQTGNYNDSNVAALLSNFGSNNISTSGNVTADYILVTGGLTTFGASPAPIISGFRSISTVKGSNTDEGNITAAGNLISNFNAFITGNISTGNLSATGNLTAGNINANVNGFNIGYRDIPQVVFTSNATLALSDAGKHYFSSNSANVITVPNNSTVSFNIGAAITIVQQGTANLTITPGVGVTMYLSGNTTSASRILGNYGMATVMKVGTDTWFINGTGLT
jgi:hypothetical protein